MKKSELKEIIFNAIKKRVDESEQAASEPNLQLPGYGNMPLSAWKKDVVRRAEEILKYAKEGNFKNVQYAVKDNGVFSNILKMLVTHEGVDEQVLGATTNPIRGDDDKKDSVAGDDTMSMSPADRSKAAAYKKDQSKLTGTVNKLDAEVEKLNAPVMKKTQDIDRKKSAEQQRLGKVTKNLDDLTRKYSK